MSLNASLFLDGLDSPEIEAHPPGNDGRPFVWVRVGPYGARVSLWGHDAASFRRVADALFEAARQLEAPHGTVTTPTAASGAPAGNPSVPNGGDSGQPIADAEVLL